MLTTGFLSRHHQCINNYFYPSVDLIRRWQQLVFLIQIYVFGCFIVVLGFFQFNTYMYGPRQSILMPLDTFKRVQLKISSLFLNHNICCWYSKNCLNDTVLWAPNLCYYLYQNICCEYSKYRLDETVLLSTQKQMLKIWFFVCLRYYTDLYREKAFHYSILAFYYSILAFYYSILAFYYSILAFYNSILAFYYSILAFYNSILAFYYSILAFYNSILAFYYSILAFNITRDRCNTYGPQRYDKGDIVILGLGFSKNIVFFYI